LKKWGATTALASAKDCGENMSGHILNTKNDVMDRDTELSKKTLIMNKAF
jgi:hypothetical protein